MTSFPDSEVVGCVRYDVLVKSRTYHREHGGHRNCQLIKQDLLCVLWELFGEKWLFTSSSGLYFLMYHGNDFFSIEPISKLPQLFWKQLKMGIDLRLYKKTNNYLPKLNILKLSHMKYISQFLWYSILNIFR